MRADICHEKRQKRHDTHDEVLQTDSREPAASEHGVQALLTPLSCEEVHTRITEHHEQGPRERSKVENLTNQLKYNPISTVPRITRFTELQ